MGQISKRMTIAYNYTKPDTRFRNKLEKACHCSCFCKGWQISKNTWIIGSLLRVSRLKFILLSYSISSYRTIFWVSCVPYRCNAIFGKKCLFSELRCYVVANHGSRTHTHAHLPQQVWAWCEELPFAAAACVWSLWPWIVHWLCLQHSNSFQFVFGYSAEMAIFVLYHLISSLSLMNTVPKKEVGWWSIKEPC